MALRAIKSIFVIKSVLWLESCALNEIGGTRSDRNGRKLLIAHFLANVLHFGNYFSISSKYILLYCDKVLYHSFYISATSIFYL